MSLPETYVKLIQTDCPEGQEPEFRVTLVVSEAIYFKADDKYYQFHPDFGVIPGYAVYEGSNYSLMIIPEQHIVFIGQRVEFKDGFMGYSVFKVNQSVAQTESSGLIEVEKPECDFLIAATKNCSTQENATSIVKGHINFLHRSKGKHPFLNVNMDKDSSFGIDDHEAPKIEYMFYLDP